MFNKLLIDLGAPIENSVVIKTISQYAYFLICLEKLWGPPKGLPPPGKIPAGAHGHILYQ